MEPQSLSQDRPRRRATGGRMVLTPGNAGLFKAVVTYEDGHTTEHPFETLQDGEAFLRSRNAVN